MEVVWVHNFPPDNPVAGVFMHQLVKYVKGLGINVSLVYTGKLRTPYDFFISRQKLASTISKNALVHAQYGSGCGFLASLLPNKKILTLRGSDWYAQHGSSISQLIHGKLTSKLTSFSLPRYDHTIVMSNRMKLEIISKLSVIKKSSISVLPDGVDFESFFPTKDNRVPSSSNHFPKSHQILFSTAKRNNPIKRFWLAEKAVEILRLEGIDVEIKIMNNVPHEKVNDFINGCDVLLLTSTHEGWPNIVKECLACNIPFVSTDVSDLSKIANDKDSGSFVVNDDPKQLAEALKKVLLSNKEVSYREKIRHEMDIKVIAQRLVVVYEGLLYSS